MSKTQKAEDMRLREALFARCEERGFRWVRETITDPYAVGCLRELTPGQVRYLMERTSAPISKQGC
jgi:hypothetical protein